MIFQNYIMPPKRKVNIKQLKQHHKVISSGEYGILFRDVVGCQCGNCNHHDLEITKAFEHSSDAQHEIKFNQKFDDIDPDGHFHLLGTQTCPAANNIMFMRNGKTDLSRYLELKRINAVTVHKILRGLLFLFYGNIVMADHKIIHGDIKLENIVVDQTNSKFLHFRYIDFSLSRNFSFIKDRDGSSPYHDEVYFAWPFDIKLLFRKSSGYLRKQMRSFFTRHHIRQVIRSGKRYSQSELTKFCDQIELLNNDGFSRYSEIAIKKIDTFALGIVLHSLITKMAPVMDGGLFDNLNSLAQDMTDYNTYRRCSPKLAMARYCNIIRGIDISMLPSELNKVAKVKIKFTRKNPISED